MDLLIKFLSKARPSLCEIWFVDALRESSSVWDPNLPLVWQLRHQKSLNAVKAYVRSPGSNNY